MIKSNLKYILSSAALMLIIILIGVGGSYAYFELEDKNDYFESSASTTTYDIESSLSKKDGININNFPLIEETEIDDKAASIDFTIRSKAKTKSPGKFNVYLKDIAISNSLKDSSFRWQLIMDGQIIESGDFSNIDERGQIDSSKQNEGISYYRTYYVGNNISFNGLNTSNIKLRMYLLNDPEKDQSNMLESSFEGKVAVEAYNALYVCIKATSLHSNNSTTYGSISTDEMLTSGDAFDCDVNGDGKYDSDTERFYYLTDLDSDNKYAVLIYSNNTYDGVINNSQAVSYSSSDNGYISGPDVAYANLPRTSQWITKVKSDTNIIKNESGVEVKNDFHTENLSARLLRYNEILKACPNAKNSLANCSYLYENTSLYSDANKTGYWIENVSSTNPNSAMFINGADRIINFDSVTNTENYGVRPVIEVLKSDIKY